MAAYRHVPITGISSGTLSSVIEYGLPLRLVKVGVGLSRSELVSVSGVIFQG